MRWKRTLLCLFVWLLLILAVPGLANSQENQAEKGKELNKSHFDTWQTIKRLEIVR